VPPEPGREYREKEGIMQISETIVNKTGSYLTSYGYKPCFIKRYFTLYGDEFADISTPLGQKTHVKKWRVIEDRD